MILNKQKMDQLKKLKLNLSFYNTAFDKRENLSAELNLQNLSENQAIPKLTIGDMVKRL